MHCSMESKNVYIIVRESVSRGFSSTLVSPWFYDTFSDAAERMKKMLSDEKERFSDEAEVSFYWNDQCRISEGPAHSVTLRIEKLEKYREGQPSCRYNAIDLGLPSVIKWSDRNVGASSPEGFGDYFMWGSVTPDTDNVCKLWAHAPFNGGLEDFDEKYFNAHKSEWLTNEGVLKPEYDAAHVNMGNSWRMPTSAEMQELLDGTTQSVETLNGIEGMRFTSKSNGNSIFIPFAGYRHGSDVNYVGYKGYAWSSSLGASGAYFSHSLDFGDDGDVYVNVDIRFYGFAVRGVCIYV